MLYTAHGFPFYRGAPLKNWLLYYTLERLAARWTDGLIVINNEDYQVACGMGFKPGENLFYVPGVGVDLGKYTRYPGTGALRKELGISQVVDLRTLLRTFSVIMLKDKGELRR
ncbi:hypothetical protein V3F56_00285 [Moorellaceae bacterium AZ2]